MCNFCEPYGWNKKTCDFCGIGSKVFISISIEFPDEESQYPYTQTDLCKKCWKKYGIKPAIEHNNSLKEKEPRNDQ